MSEPIGGQTATDEPPSATAALADEIELAWQARWRPTEPSARNPAGPALGRLAEVAGRPHAFIMDMFPYPSGEGLHVGHPLGYIATDTPATSDRGDNVLHSMGLTRSGCPLSSTPSRPAPTRG
jgi:leucyl-tRNA synthetase